VDFYSGGKSQVRIVGSGSGDFYASIMPTPAYVYQPLENPRKQFRLLTVYPNRDRNAGVEGTLSIHQLPDSNAPRFAQFRMLLRLPWYYAVSYVWGAIPALSETKRISIDGCDLIVSSHVYAGLQEARTQISSSFKVWFDATCIDQSNDREKDGQIPLMREIYHFSIHTFIYIPGSEEDAKLIRFINRLNVSPRYIAFGESVLGAYTKRNSEKPETNSAWLKGLGAAVLMNAMMLVIMPYLRFLLAVLKSLLKACGDQTKELSSVSRSKFYDDKTKQLKAWQPKEASLRAIESDDMVEMAQRIQSVFSGTTQYFNRMWTFQEAITNIIVGVHCANVETTLEGLVHAVHYLDRVHGLDPAFVDTMTTLSLVRSNWVAGHRFPLQELLFYCQNRDCHDPRDKIYALTGLINDRMDPRLQPNQQHSVAEVYAKATKYIISAQKSLDVICVRGRKEPNFDLPSWVPNFQEFGVSNGRTMLVDPSGRKAVFQASADERHTEPESFANRVDVLHTYGLHLGIIRRISPAIAVERLEELWKWILACSPNLDEESQQRMTDLSTLLCHLAELWRVYDVSKRAAIWVAVESDINMLSKVRFDEEQIKWLLVLMCGLEESNKRCDSTEVLVTLRQACFRMPYSDRTLNLLFDALQKVARGRRLVVLDSGNIGLVPEEVMIGDAVCVLAGCDVPVCLRGTSIADEWRLIGESFVYGYMDAEAVAKISEHPASVYLLV
jgi:hypothetical protein